VEEDLPGLSVDRSAEGAGSGPADSSGRFRRVQAIAREKDDLLRLFLEHVPAAIAMLDREMRYLAASSRWMSDYNLGDRDLFGVSHYEVFPEVKPEWREMHQRCLQGEVARPGEERFERADGSVQWIRGEIHPWRDHSGEVGGIIMFTEVITEQKEAQLALRESQERLQDFLENAGDLIQNVSLEGRFLYANRAFRETLGYELEDLKGLSFFDVVRADLRAACLGLFARVVTKQTFGHLTTTLVGKGGREVEVEGSLHGRFEHGRVADSWCIFRDVTERNRAQRALQLSEERYKDLVENASDIIYTHTPDGTMTSANAAVLRAYGYTLDELLGLNIASLVDPASLEVARESIRRKTVGFTERSEPYELLTRAKDGREIWLEISTRIVKEAGVPVAIHGIGRDVTERKKAEEERRHVERLKAEFVTMVTHELRTPLTSVKISLGMLADGMAGELPGRARDVVKVADRNVGRLVHLINDIMALERLDAGRLEMQLEPVPVQEIIDLSLESVRAVAAAEGIGFEEPETQTAMVMGDRDRLVQVMVNLLGNAVKFSPVGGHVRIAVTEEPGWVELNVTDSGRGIPTGQERVVFEPFRQLTASDAREKGGTGLGLAICKAIVEQHGGAIGVISQEDKGSVFWFRVPAA